MPANVLSSVFRLFASSDGSTISGSLRVDGYPLVQRYTAGTDKYIPDFGQLAEADRPTVYPVLRNQADASVVIPNTYTWKYNDVTLTFDSSTNLSTNSGMEGTFQRITAYRVTVGGTQYTMQALRVMKNLASASNHDNDRITLDGTIEMAGASTAFAGLSKDVVIQESTGNQYSAVITNGNGSALTDDVTSLTEQLNIYKDGVLLTDRTGITYQWYIVKPAGNTNLGTAATQAVTRDQVDNIAVIGCDVKLDGSTVATAFDMVTDYGDPYDVRWDVSGMSGQILQKGETATLTPVPVKRSTQAEDASLVSTWDWTVWDNSGAGFTLAGKDGATFQAKSATVTYAELKSAGYGMSFMVSANYNV